MGNLKFAVIGAGNGGQAFAGYIANKGYEVRLFDFFQETTDKIKEKGCIQLTGDIEEKGELAYVGNDMQEAIEGVDVIMVVNPSTYHHKIAITMAPYLKKEQYIFLSPASTFGSFAFKKSLESVGYTEKVTIAESNTLLFACRATEPGTVLIGGKKDRILVATFPACENDNFHRVISEVIPEVQMCETVLETGLDNTNPMVHPLPTIMNVNWVENGGKFKYYWEGIGPTMGAFIEDMDQERIEIGKALGMELGKNLFSLQQQYEIEYHAKGITLSEIVKDVAAYEDIYAAPTVRSRYIYEDIPTALLPLAELGELLGLKTEKMRFVIKMCELMLDEDLTTVESARNAESLGFSGLDRDGVIKYAKLGER